MTQKFPLPNRDEYLKLRGFQTQEETAIYYGVCKDVIKRLDKEFDVHTHHQVPNESVLTPTQKEIFVGSMLGDGTLNDRIQISPGSNSKFVLPQTQKYGRREYIDSLFDSFGMWSCSIQEHKASGGIVKGRPIKSGPSWQFHSISHRFFTNQHKQWYFKNIDDENIKKLPDELLLTPLTMAHWAVQDGINSFNERRFDLCAECFTNDERQRLIELLKSFGIYATITYRLRLRISQYKNYLNLIDTIKPFVVWNCFDYKVKVKPIEEFAAMPRGGYRRNKYFTR